MLEDRHAKIKSEPGSCDAMGVGDWNPPLGQQDHLTKPHAMQVKNFEYAIENGKHQGKNFRNMLVVLIILENYEVDLHCNVMDKLSNSTICQKNM